MALQNERYHKLAALAQAVERDAAMAVGRPHGDAIDGAVLVGRQRICMWVPDLGLALRGCPGMTQSSGADCSAPGISPCPLRGSRPT